MARRRHPGRCGVGRLGVLIVVRLDLPDDDLPYLSLHPAIAGWTSWLRLDKLPIDAHWRSQHVPAWDHAVTRVARFWSAATGTDELMIRRLEDRTVPDEMIESPAPEGLRDALQAALPRSEQHLTEVLEGYWTRDWRRQHQGNGIYPEDHLWRAAEAVQSIRNTLHEL